MPRSGPRVPLPVPAALPGGERIVQVNHCKMPACKNYGVPACTEHRRGNRPEFLDLNYYLRMNLFGFPVLQCRECEERPPIKSNEGIVEEVRRLVDESGIWTLEESTGCHNEDCENHERPIAFHRDEYRKRGKTRNRKGQYYECKQCRAITLLSEPVGLRGNERYAVGLLSRLANKAPAKGCIRGLGLKSGQAYYRIVDFLVRRCRSYSGRVDRALIDGRLQLPADLSVECDSQIYQLNWVSRMDRRNVRLSACCTVDSNSGFIFGLHSNFDGRLDPFQANLDFLQTGDHELTEPFRKYSQYWMVGDELGAGRRMGKRDRSARVDVLTRVQELYDNAATRADVENIELEGLNTDYVTPFLSNGLQVHMPYTTYAHWFLMHRILTGAGVERIQFHSDIDAMNRAAFVAAFVEEVKRGDAHAFFVNYTKYQTIDERRTILKDAKRRMNAYRDAAPERREWSKKKLARAMMKEYIEAAEEHGDWHDEWVTHPLPTINEPNKAMSWLTPDPDLDEDQTADLFLRASLARVDNVFMKTRRLCNALERPVGSSSSHNRAWHGDAARVCEGAPVLRRPDLARRARAAAEAGAAAGEEGYRGVRGSRGARNRFSQDGHPRPPICPARRIVHPRRSTAIESRRELGFVIIVRQLESGFPVLPTASNEAEMTADECIAIMVERIVLNFRPLKILLFGSQARGAARPDSDIDLIVVFPSVADEYELTADIRGSLSDLLFAKDVLVTTPDEIERRLSLPGDVLRSAIPESRVLYECAA